MRLSATSFTHASTAIFGVAVVGYAAVRLVTFAAPYAAPHLPGHHGGAAHPQPRVLTVRQEPERASRSARRAAAPTQRVVRHTAAATADTHSRRDGGSARADDATAVPLEQAGRWRRVEVEPDTDTRDTVAWHSDEPQTDLRTDEREGWSRPAPTPSGADSADTSTTHPVEPTDDDAPDEPDDN